MSTLSWIVLAGLAMSALALIGAVTIALPPHVLDRVLSALVGLAAGSPLPPGHTRRTPPARLPDPARRRTAQLRRKARRGRSVHRRRARRRRDLAGRRPPRGSSGTRRLRCAGARPLETRICAHLELRLHRSRRPASRDLLPDPHPRQGGAHGAFVTGPVVLLTATRLV